MDARGSRDRTDAGWRGEELPDLRMLGQAPATTDAAGEPLLLLQTLGACVVRVGDRRIDPSMEILFALVIRLTHTPGMRVPRSVLLAELWAGMAELRARANLRQALYKLRGFGVRVFQVGEEVTLERAGCVRVFALERTGAQFEACVTRGNEPFGVFLPGYRPQWPAFERWLGATREAVHADVRGVLVEQLRARRQRADWSGTHALARWLLQFDPLNEDATLAHAECTMMEGAKAEAVAILDTYLAELGASAGDIRLPATLLRRRITEARPVGRLQMAPSERHFVGREELMTELAHQMRRARWREGSVLMLSGPAGMGKSRVMRELAKVAALEGFQAVTIACRESDRERPLGVLRELVSELLELPGAMGCAPPTLRVLRRFSASVDRGERDGIVEVEVLDESPPTPAALRRAIVDLLSAIGFETPVCLEVDDVHWLDGESGKVIGELCLLEDHRVFAVLTSRGDATPWLAPEQRRALVRHELEPLRADQASALVEAMAEEMCVTPTVSALDWIVATGGGNPFYLRALLLHWADTGATSGIPPTLGELVDHGLSTLSDDARHALQAIALLGRFATPMAIEGALELPASRLLAVLDELAQGATVREDGASRMSVHDLVRDAVVARLSGFSRRVLHWRIAEALRTQVLALDAASAVEIVSHLIAAGATSQVLKFTLETAQQYLHEDRTYLAAAICDEAFRVEEIGGHERLAWLRTEALMRSGNHARVVDLTHGSEADVASTADDSVAHQTLNFLDSSRSSWVWDDYREYTARALLIAESPQLSSQTRFRAAGIALKTATLALESATAERALLAGLEAAQALSTTQLAQDELRMYFHTAFGDPSLGLSSAKAIAEGLDSVGILDGSQLNLLSNAAYAMRVNGAPDDGRRIHSTVLEVAIRHEHYFVAIASTWNLAMYHIDHDFSPLEAQHRIADGFRFASRINNDSSRTILLEAGAKLAILMQDSTQAHRIWHELRPTLAKSSVPIRRSSYYALELGVAALLKDSPVLEKKLDEALEHFCTMRSQLSQDFFALQLSRALAVLGRNCESRALLDRYITQHRRRGQLRPWYILRSQSIE